MNIAGSYEATTVSTIEEESLNDENSNQEITWNGNLDLLELRQNLIRSLQERNLNHELNSGMDPDAFISQITRSAYDWCPRYITGCASFLDN